MDTGRRLDVLGDKTRRAIFEALAHRPSAVVEIASQIPVSRPAVSQHLRTLSEAGLVSARREGNRRIYSVEPTALSELAEWLDALWEKALDKFENQARKEHDIMHPTAMSISPVTKTRTVPLPLDAAFELFTEKIATWWPLDTHSIAVGMGLEPPVDVRFEGRIGGRVVEIETDGSEQVWAEVIAWQPPHRFVLAWHPTPDPIAATILEVRFSDIDAGTRIDLEHRSWEELGDEGPSTRESYDSGWELVLGSLADSAAEG